MPPSNGIVKEWRMIALFVKNVKAFFVVDRRSFSFSSLLPRVILPVRVWNIKEKVRRAAPLPTGEDQGGQQP